MESGRVRSSLPLLSMLVLSACAEPGSVRPAPQTRLDFVSESRGRARPVKADAPSRPIAGSAECRDPPSDELAHVSCDAERIVLARPVSFHPRRSIPPAPARAVLERVAALLRQRPDIQLVRVESYSSRPAGASAEARRREMAESQRRADAVLRFLWRRGGISAERLEAVGYGFDPRFQGAAERWPIVLRIVQRRD